MSPPAEEVPLLQKQATLVSKQDRLQGQTAAAPFIPPCHLTVARPAGTLPLRCGAEFGWRLQLLMLQALQRLPSAQVKRERVVKQHLQDMASGHKRHEPHTGLLSLSKKAIWVLCPHCTKILSMRNPPCSVRRDQRVMVCMPGVSSTFHASRTPTAALLHKKMYWF